MPMTPDDLLKAKRKKQSVKIMEQLCRDLKKMTVDAGVSIGYISGETYINDKNICDILNCKGDPQLSTLCNILLAADCKLVIVKTKGDEKKG